MRIKLRKEDLAKLFFLATNKAGTEAKLSRILLIPEGSIYSYKNALGTLPKDRFDALLKFLNIDKTSIKTKMLDDNWGCVLGGKKVVLVKKAKNTFYRDMFRLKLLSSIRMKKWHLKMKKENPEFYYKLQYKRFKKVNKYPLIITKSKVRVRNVFEREIADFLYENNIKFNYEPYLNINGKAYFPDFITNNNLIEVTAWKHPDESKILYLKNKIKNYRLYNYNIIFYIPKKYSKFYKEINEFIISDLNSLKIKLMPQ